MATNKMKLRHAYRIGGDDYVEGIYGVRISKDEKSLHRQIDQAIVEDKEIQDSLKTEESKGQEELVEKMEYLETLDINQLRGMVKSIGIPHKNIMKMKKEEIIAELLK